MIEGRPRESLVLYENPMEVSPSLYLASADLNSTKLHQVQSDHRFTVL